MTRTDNNENVIRDVLSAISEDRRYDGKSIVWNGSRAQVVPDELDNIYIMDGRFGMFMTIKLETELGITLLCPSTKNNRKLFSKETAPAVNSPAEYRIETVDRYLSMTVSDIEDYEKKVAALCTDIGLMERDNMKLGGDKEYRLFTGIVETESGADMIGFVLSALLKDGRSLVLKYSGLGNYSDIEVEAVQIMQSILERY